MLLRRPRPVHYRYANRRAFTKLENYRVPTWKELSILAIAIEDLTHPSEPEPWPVDVDLFRQ